MMLGQNENGSIDAKTVRQNARPQNQFGLTRQHLDAISRVAVWGPLSIYGAAGKPIPRWMRFFMLGAGVAQVLQGLQDLRRNNGRQ